MHMNRSLYAVRQNLTAYALQSEEGYAQKEYVIPKGEFVWAIPTKQQWERQEVVKFTWGYSWYYADWRRFWQSALKTADTA